MKFVIIGCCLIWSTLSMGQEFHGYVDQQKQLQERAMLVLGTWGAVNLVSGGVGFASSEGASRYFHQMNMGWGLVNAGIATIGYYGARKLKFNDPGFFNLYDHNANLSRTLVFNTGLDVGYMAFGLYLRERSKNVIDNSERLKGFGTSLLIQGAFLFLFDASTFYFNHQIGGQIKKQVVELNATSNGLGITLIF